ncbi:MAG: 16S rRNA (cytidine(1402)-2'-O)-methyltransferase [Thermoanaerobaculaceae bacterium]|nr:16S rRNA (cytidine(1402)-2'-O)-methyltransferase [Thermoanaerobaculaceae bacterium]MDI9620394.1 16S rRNA (cytidine(1402)-2'-O)-methyltransferase [Acidobacteriota bacterium]
MRKAAERRAGAAPLSPGGRSPSPGTLWVVATPIGNLHDCSPRAVETLRRVATVLAEDTRQVRKLLSHFGISTPTKALYEHNEEHLVPSLVARLLAGEELALVSDAGTPLLSDPGFRLVRGCRKAGVPVLTVPGPSAVAAALTVSGLPPIPFTFLGFLPPRAGARQRLLTSVRTLPHTLVIFVSPHRLGDELAACAGALGGDRPAALCSELTKLHERCRQGTLAELAVWAEHGEARGEHTLVIGPGTVAVEADVGREDARRALEAALAKGLVLAGARREAASALGISRRRLFELLAADR